MLPQFVHLPASSRYRCGISRQELAGSASSVSSHSARRCGRAELPPVPPMFCASPTRAPLTWRSPASPRSCLSASHDLRHAGRADRVALGLQAAAGVDRELRRRARSGPAATAGPPLPGSTKPSASMAMISAMVKQSWTSTTWRSEPCGRPCPGPPARLYGGLDPGQVRAACCSVMVSVAWPRAGDLDDGPSCSARAISTGARTTAAAPSVMGEQSRMRSGSATRTELRTCSDRHLDRELGQRVHRAVVVVLDRDLASCSRVVPYLCMWATAIMA